MLNTQLLEVLGTKTFDVQEDLFEFNITDTIVLQVSDSPDTHSKVGSFSICPPRKTSVSFNSYCC
ncbi:mutacin-like lanthipeptide [Streptococcus mutans]|uniref:mutacin-like lanthipeptide n=1 Tax=Streptococcus mutans TaxID=1309 RepID=UPI0014558151|nr:mutacin-like lanthipeptide [Streptococcus mutans]MDP5865228.1 mutacin-like lanthipeptide [Streptococcus mutans]NLQ48773.1 gallidermin/nisin family lantibiotic [Streptococcus mutans]